MFIQIDTNGNGVLDKDEVRQFSIAMMGQLKKDAEFDEAKFEENFVKLDKNADGRVSKEELYANLIEKAIANGVITEWLLSEVQQTKWYEVWLT